MKKKLLLTNTSSLNFILLFQLLISTFTVLAQSSPEHLSLDDLRDYAILRQPVISPDGRYVAVVVERPDYEQNRWEVSLELIELETGEHRELTPGRLYVGDPQWSPSGDRLAFLDAGEDGPMQLHVLPMRGGEARRLTNGKESVKFYEWSPDGRTIVFGRMYEPEVSEGEDQHNRSFEVGDNSYLIQSRPRSTHLWRIAADGGEPERLTEGFDSVDECVWAPDGKTLALAVRPTPHSGADIHRTIQLLELGSRERRVLSTMPGNGLAFSPDGKSLAFIASRGKEMSFVPSGVFVVPRAGGEPRNVTAGLDRDVLSTAWLQDGSGLLVMAPDVTRIRVWYQPLDGGAQLLNLGPVDPAVGPPGPTTGFTLSDHGHFLFIGMERHRPYELYVMDSPEGSPQRITDMNATLASRKQGRRETVTWAGPDGFELSGVLTYPPGYEAGRKYPLVLVIHGGPMLTSTESFNPEIQSMAGQGWLIFQPNYRGSNNQGLEFQRALINDAGDGPARDVMSGVELLKSRGLADETRIAVSGLSYGGFLTAWLAAHYDGWAAAVAYAPATDWFDQYNASDGNTWFGFLFGGSPWLNDNAANYWQQSPMAHAHRIQTPMLILSTTGDEHVTVTQSYKLYHALKENDVEVQFIAYPGSGHFPADPVHQRDVFRRWIDWIEEHFEPRANPGSESSMPVQYKQRK